MDFQEVIDKLGLEPLPEEGGFYKEVHRAKGYIPESVLKEHSGDRCYATHIYYLLTPEEFSGLHRVIGSDEIFHFYLGDPVEMVQMDEENQQLKRIVLGQDLLNDQKLQTTVSKGIWQGTRLLEGGQWALLGCTVAPGFEFADFEIKSREEFKELFPEHLETVESFTR